MNVFRDGITNENVVNSGILFYKVTKISHAENRKKVCASMLTKVYNEYCFMANAVHSIHKIIRQTHTLNTL